MSGYAACSLGDPAAQTVPGAASLVLVAQDGADVRHSIGPGLVVDRDDLMLADCVDTVADVVPAIRKALSLERGLRGARG